MNYYNGYSPKERARKLDASHRRWRSRSEHPCSKPPCHLCGDPAAKVQPHSEDYSEPYEWEPPYTYALCERCHKRIHTRFANPAGWFAYKSHLRRGGYGSDLGSPKIAREVHRLAKALESGRPFSLAPIRQRILTGSEWWERLSTDPRTLDHPWARPR
jgi:hypothetical protein